MLQYFDYAKFWYYTRANHIILVGWLDGLVWGGGVNKNFVEICESME